MRAHMAELGIVAAQGREGTKALLAIIADDGARPVASLWDGTPKTRVD